MHTRVSRVVEEYVFRTEAVEYSVKGRVVEHFDVDPKGRYGWEISHHYKPSTSAAGVYYPSSIDGASVEEVRGQMLAYLRGFQNIDVEPNSSY
jgi:hypothetical protein